MNRGMGKCLQKEKDLRNGSGKMSIGGWKDVLEDIMFEGMKKEGKEVVRKDVKINWSSIRYLVVEKDKGLFELDGSGRVVLKSLKKKEVGKNK